MDDSTFRQLCELSHDLNTCQLAIDGSATQLQQVQDQLQHVALHFQHQLGEADVMAVVQNLTDLHQNAAAEHQRNTARLAEIQSKITKASTSKDLSGPCLRSVEPVLQQHHIQRQAYHGGAFIGNHVHEALKPTVVTAITHSHIQIVQERCPELAQEATTVATRYHQLLTNYATCREIFSHCNAVSDEDLVKLNNEIRQFVSKCRTEIVHRGLGHITPKIHLLEEHTLPLMQKFRVGLGLLAEQGAESLHSSMNTLDVLFKNIPGSLARLKSVADQHLLTTTKEASTLQPRPRKRKAEQQREESSTAQ